MFRIFLASDRQSILSTGHVDRWSTCIKTIVQYSDFLFEENTVERPSYLYDGNPYNREYGLYIAMAPRCYFILLWNSVGALCFLRVQYHVFLRTYIADTLVYIMQIPLHITSIVEHLLVRPKWKTDQFCDGQASAISSWIRLLWSRFYTGLKYQHRVKGPRSSFCHGT